MGAQGNDLAWVLFPVMAQGEYQQPALFPIVGGRGIGKQSLSHAATRMGASCWLSPHDTVRKAVVPGAFPVQRLGRAAIAVAGS